MADVVEIIVQDGVSGDRGWSPMIRTVADDDRQVLELYDWTGGQGTKPTTSGYLSPTGLTSDIAEATNIKGDSGGSGSVNWGQVGGLLSDQSDLWSELGGKATPQDIIDALAGLGLGSAAFTDSSDYATSAQGAKADSALQSFTESDPTVPSHVKLISTENISSWNLKATTTDIANAIDALNLGTASEADVSDFATAAQGALAATAVQPSGLPTWSTISGKPSFVAEGANAAAARTALGLGTAATQASGAFATAAQGALADTAVQPSDTSDVADAGKVVKYSNIGAVNTATPQFPENAVPLSYFDAGLSTKQNTLSTPSQAEAEAGTSATPRSWSAERDRQAIVAASRLIVVVSANKTLALTDEYTYQRVTAAATITIPTNASVALPVGAEIDFFQAGAGAITFSPDSGVTVNSYEDTLVTDGKGAAATLKKVATNEWDLII